MKEIWLICSGCYSDINWHGFLKQNKRQKTIVNGKINTHLVIGIGFGIVR